MTEWKPIETAPRDGREIMAINAEAGEFARPRFCRWFRATRAARNGTEFWAVRGTSQAIHPTHWMPLPEPPRAD